MREILFRGKRKDNGECIEGSAINTQYDVRGERYVYIGILICSETHPLMQTITWYAVDPETVGQFTGLHDATPWEELTTDEQALFLYPENGDKRSKEDWKGKPIFEGDIVECFSSDYAGRPKIDTIKVKDMTDYNTMVYLNCSNELRKIGNIHDNPESLKEGVDIG